jgi:hypothetical protein
MPRTQLINFRPCPLFPFFFFFLQNKLHTPSWIFDASSHHVITLSSSRIIPCVVHQRKAHCKFAFTVLQNNCGNAHNSQYYHILTKYKCSVHRPLYISISLDFVHMCCKTCFVHCSVLCKTFGFCLFALGNFFKNCILKKKTKKKNKKPST